MTYAWVINMPMHNFFSPAMFISELVYTIIIVVFCFLIYFRTKHIYDLTKYKGIGYFRNTFMLFGIAYLARFLFQVLALSNRTLELFIPFRMFGPFSLVITSYLSTIAIFYLVYSTIWKRIKFNHFLLFSNLIAILLSIIAILNRSPELISLSQLALLIFAVILSLFRQKSKKFSQIKVLYILILIFWLFNFFVTGPRRFIPFEIKSTFQIISLVVFFIIHHKVTKWIR